MPTSAAGQSCASPDMDTQSSSSSSMQCCAHVDALLGFCSKLFFFQKLKGVMKGKGGAGAVAMGKALISNFTPGGFTFVSTIDDHEPN